MQPVPNVKPRWYQDLSLPQNVFALGNTMRADCAERVTARTQRALADIGVTSTYVKVPAEQIKKMCRLTDLDPVKFLCEIYRSVTGKSFVDEEYKDVYDCNERIILSAIAFLMLPEIVFELHRRIPMTEAPKFPPKPVPGKMASRRRAKSPYLEPLFVRPNWLTYKEELDIWRKQCQAIAIPRVILPCSVGRSRIYEAPESVDAGFAPYQEEDTDKRNDNSRIQGIGHQKQTFDKDREGTQRSNLTFTGHQTEPNSSKKKVNYQSDNSDRKYGATKSWLGEKNTPLIVAGSAVNNDMPDRPISLETSGRAYVTPDNSDQDFFASLKVNDAAKKRYPRGKENLSRKWQEWLHDAEEDYKEAEKQANKILKNVERTLKLMDPDITCDSCCACRQTTKANIKYHKTKTPKMVIDSVVVDGEQNKYVVGSLAINSPAPSPSESTENLPEVVASHDKIIKSNIISGVADEGGRMRYCVCGVSKYVKHVSRKTKTHATQPKPVKNVPPCCCAIEEAVNKGMTTATSSDNIPWTSKKEQMCVGKKYRPHAGGACSCREYPCDKSCRRNPFKKKVDERLRGDTKKNLDHSKKGKAMKIDEKELESEDPDKTTDSKELESSPTEQDNAKTKSTESVKDGPLGLRTKSQQELPPEKTVVYLVEPKEPVETIPVRAGGRPCKCRENRNSKKKLLHGVSGMAKEGRGRYNKKFIRVIDSSAYITPTPSIRNSDEYIPEYELSDAPHGKCERACKGKNFGYIEKYLGPKSLMLKKPGEASARCVCSTAKNKSSDAGNQENAEESTVTDSVSESAEKSQTDALQADDSNDADARCPDNVPCSYKRTLQVKKPVCECKYERKIVKHEEEKEHWLCRQARLKNLKKVPYNQVAGLSRPMETETNPAIYDIARVPRRRKDDIDCVKYCLSGIVQSRVMGPAECILTGVGMYTPVSTPKLSKEDTKINIYTRPASSTKTQTISRNPKRQKLDTADTVKYSKPGPPDSTEDRDLERNMNSPDTTSKNESAAMLIEEVDKSVALEQKSATSIRSKAEEDVSSDEKTEVSRNTNMKNLMKIELQKMAEEGFLFAKLPACWQFPQLQYWLMYRKGFALPPNKKQKLMEHSLFMWNSVKKLKVEKMRAPSFEESDEVIEKWNFNEANKLKHKIAAKGAQFQSNVRKFRVLYARNMWRLMECGKFPGISFKKAYFTYLASKESDGFVFKPWQKKGL